VAGAADHTELDKTGPPIVVVKKGPPIVASRHAQGAGRLGAAGHSRRLRSGRSRRSVGVGVWKFGSDRNRYGGWHRSSLTRFTENCQSAVMTVMSCLAFRKAPGHVVIGRHKNTRRKLKQFFSLLPSQSKLGEVRHVCWHVTCNMAEPDN